MYRNYPTEEARDLKDLLLRAARRFPDKTYLWEKRNGALQSVSFGEFLADVNAIGEALSARLSDVGRVLLAGPSSRRWATAYFAVVCSGGTVIPLDASLSAADLAESARRTEASAVICTDRLAENLSHVLSEKKTESACKNPSPIVIPFGELPALAEKGRALIKRGKSDQPRKKIDPNTICAIQFESGSAADGSLGVMLSHRNFCFSVAELCRMIELRSDDVLLSVLPLRFSHTLTCNLLAPLACGGSVAFCGGLKNLAKSMREVRPTVMVCPPVIPETMHRRISARLREIGLEKKTDAWVKATNSIPSEDLRATSKRHAFAAIHESFGGRLRLLLSCGGAISPEALRGLRDLGILTLQGYGRAECTSLLSLNRDRFFRDETAGLPLPNTLVDLSEMQDDGTGEIRCKGAHVMLGYYGAPASTEEVLRNGWYYTGEIGYLDGDGFLHVIGKKKNVILAAGGLPIFPEELEALLCATPYVREAIVVGKPNPDRGVCDAVALIYPDLDRLHLTYGNECTEEQIRAELRRAVEDVNSSVAPHKHIRSFQIRTSEFPKTSSNRIARAEIRLKDLGRG